MSAPDATSSRSVNGDLVLAVGPGTADWLRTLDGFRRVTGEGEAIGVAVRGAVQRGSGDGGARWVGRRRSRRRATSATARARSAAVRRRSSAGAAASRRWSGTPAERRVVRRHRSLLVAVAVHRSSRGDVAARRHRPAPARRVAVVRARRRPRVHLPLPQLRADPGARDHLPRHPPPRAGDALALAAGRAPAVEHRLLRARVSRGRTTTPRTSSPTRCASGWWPPCATTARTTTRTAVGLLPLGRHRQLEHREHPGAPADAAACRASRSASPRSASTSSRFARTRPRACGAASNFETVSRRARAVARLARHRGLRSAVRQRVGHPHDRVRRSGAARAAPQRHAGRRRRRRDLRRQPALRQGSGHGGLVLACPRRSRRSAAPSATPSAARARSHSSTASRTSSSARRCPTPIASTPTTRSPPITTTSCSTPEFRRAVERDASLDFMRERLRPRHARAARCTASCGSTS